MKEGIYGNRVKTNLNIPEIKLFLNDKLSVIMRDGGYIFNKSAFIFKKKDKTNFEEIYFNFLNYSPLKYDVKFGFRFLNSEIENIKKKFSHPYNKEPFNFASILILMGDFIDEKNILQYTQKWTGLVFDSKKNEFVKEKGIPELKKLTRANISGFAYELYDNKELFEVGDELKSIIYEKVLPLSEQFLTLNGIDSFFEERPGWSVKSLRLNNVLTELIVAKLNRKRNFSHLSNQIMSLYNDDIKDLNNDIEGKNFISEFIKFLNELVG
jgi:hypothetical protein